VQKLRNTQAYFLMNDTRPDIVNEEYGWKSMQSLQLFLNKKNALCLPRAGLTAERQLYRSDSAGCGER